MTGATNPLYAAQTLMHRMRWRPQQAQRVPARRPFSAQAGAQVASSVDRLSTDPAEPEPVGECYLSKLGRLGMARLSAERQILRYLVLLPAEQHDPPTATVVAPPVSSTSPGATRDRLPTVPTPRARRYHERDGAPGLHR